MKDSIRMLKELEKEAKELSDQLTNIQSLDSLAQGRTVSTLLIDEWERGEREEDLEQEVLAAIIFCQNKILLAIEQNEPTPDTDRSPEY